MEKFTMLANIFINFAAMKNSFLIAAPMSGSGKTTVARGLMALLARRGYQVQPMKCGPDYIDTKFHAAVCGRPSVNLDLFMAPEEHVRALAERYASAADVTVVEGMMGLFDGYDHEHGSAYEIARALDMPVVLVVDARSAAYSMAALLKGFVEFRRDIRFLGVIFNKVGSVRHERMLREVCEDIGVPCIGCIPKSEVAQTGERYLGLDFSGPEMERSVGLLADLMEQHLDLSLLPLPGSSEAHEIPEIPVVAEMPVQGRKIVIARSSEAFSFVYQQTLDCFRDDEVVFFNPELDETFPLDADLLYLPGGYPEKHAQVLSEAAHALDCVRRYAEQGGKVIAECGGMMYLCKQILTDEGAYPMCGVLPYTVSARKADRRLSLGYRRWVLDGKEYRGHEFHYSQFVGKQPESAATVWNARGEEVNCPIIRQGHVTASYTHWYFL